MDDRKVELVIPLRVLLLILGLLLAAPLVSASERTTPVDTVELALTARSQPAHHVRERLGTPAQVIPLPTEYRVERNRSGTTVIRLEREVWVYPGNSLVGDAVITFVNGTVESAERKR
jgi:hypothetical protein